MGYSPNPDIIRMTEKVIEQNRLILEMNARLLAVFRACPILISPNQGEHHNACSASVVYRWRSECPHDDQELLKRLPKGEMLKFQSMREDPFPDTVNELTVKSLTLDELRDIMRQVEDGHVMVQTVQPKDLYTGERNYDL